MSKSSLLHRLIYAFCLQCNQILNTFAMEPDLYQLMGNRESAHWPLQAGYPGQAIKNLNEYVSRFSQCLVNIQNYQGIEIVGIKSPVYLTRFDAANLKDCTNKIKVFSDKLTHTFLYGKIPPKSEQNCSYHYNEVIKHSDKSTKSRWHCRAQFDLFFPEPVDAPHIVHHSQTRENTNLFDTSRELIDSNTNEKEAWSKILYILFENCINPNVILIVLYRFHSSNTSADVLLTSTQ